MSGNYRKCFHPLIQGVVLREGVMKSLYQFLIADKTDKDSGQNFPDFSNGPRRYFFFGFRDWLDIWHSSTQNLRFTRLLKSQMSWQRCIRARMAIAIHNKFNNFDRCKQWNHRRKKRIHTIPILVLQKLWIGFSFDRSSISRCENQH